MAPTVTATRATASKVFAVNHPGVLWPVVSPAITTVINGAGNVNRALVINRCGGFIIGRINYPAGLIVANMDTGAYPNLGLRKLC
ncbi:hypothetical protein BC343_28305 [Mucilaginibacter pedocola]|uniref:Uncharacterized protein n=1 Tax=Mucilaginibacter pedocola TaxID=1792845 RepID=A0A1S9PE97_9SPHI|nr:hypothetical protein BC343_28305 [Mucilaginibacter pedocola]